MRLTKIKLAGFKSFVDPTTFNVPGQLLAVVGPNGCGKSNIIDAVRWVMGESAAGQLRGDSMEDVIFNGSTQRKPIGQASVELVFDNGERRLEGPWGQYNEVAVKRLLTRGSGSSYFINGTRCRRRDIAAIFLGTGLGPRSYAIIEQGTISRIIESKPADLRAFFEEAAGISKYKERRRETANRIRHTEENLDRLSDLREEQGKQLAHLQRQARNAERYRELRAEEKRLRAELLALRWRALDADASQQQRQIRERETRLESLIAEQRRLEAARTRARARQTEVGDELAAAQDAHYRVGTDIARAEQSLAHRRQLRERRAEEQQRTDQGLAQVDAQIADDRRRFDELAGQNAEAELLWEQTRQIGEDAAERLSAAEQALHDWQTRWDEFSDRAGAAQRAAEVERARIEQLERQQLQSQQRAERLQAEQQAYLASAADGETQFAAQQRDYQTAAAALTELAATFAAGERRVDDDRQRRERLAQRLAQRRERQQTGRGRLSSLQTLQEAALGQADRDRSLQHWLERQGWAGAPRLAERLQAEPGWENAVEAALGADLRALCIDDAELDSAALDAAPAPLTLLGGGVRERRDGAGDTDVTDAIDADALSTKLSRPPAAAAELLAGVRVAADLDDALRRRGALRPGESLITAAGVHCGRDWLRAGAAAVDDGAGTLARGREIAALAAELDELDAELQRLTAELATATEQHDRHEQELRDTRAALNDRQRDAVQREASRDATRERLDQQRRRQQELRDDAEEQLTLLEQSRHDLVGARQRQQSAVAAMARHEDQRGELERQRDALRARVVEARAQHDGARAELQQRELALQTGRGEQAALTQALTRLGEQRERLLAAQTRLAGEEQGADVADGDADAALQRQLDALLEQRVGSERRLTEARRAAAALDAELRQLEQSLGELFQVQQRERDALGERRLSNSEVSVRRQTAEDQLRELGLTLQGVLAELPEQAAEQDWQQRLEQTAARIQRLGAINEAAIEEFEQLSERKRYLDEQNDDLLEALRTLETAIAKIDRETRSRFQDTFDRVNDGLQALFPRLFGGGRAYLELLGSDALEAGVTIMAHPPGKRNGTIHLLSGGEKALTAVALIFAIFQLNPAPFCMLDEVDAPLDDANVGRFGALLEEMSARVQLIVVTHNKGTMEVAGQLAGVTMQEPGVSRLVAVDIDEAVKLATA